MNILYQNKILLLSFFLLLVLLPKTTYPCSCPLYLNNFCDYNYPSTTIALVTVTDYVNPSLRSAKTIENINQEIEQEFFTLLGQDGLNCGELLGIFEIGDTLVLALDSYSDFSTEDSIYYLDGCGLTYLQYSNNQVSGYINGVFETQDYGEFKDNIQGCLLGVDIEDIGAKSLEIKVYPTIINHQLIIETERNLIHSVHFYSSNGELVGQFKDLNDSQATLSTADLAKGVYFVAVQTKGKTVTKKIVKI
ncbi:MAG: T9SS type A sorting domain-containing protein [Chitinophagales bacterium]